MNATPLRFGGPVTLVGGGALTPAMLAEAQAIASDVIAADGAANRLMDWGVAPCAVIGDMDSIRDADRVGASGATFVPIAEQDTTDFEKCLYATEAPLYVAAGFTGRRVDHMMAVFHALIAQPGKRVVLLGEHEVIAALAPGRTLRVHVGTGAVVSIYPLLATTGLVSDGLQWPVDGLDLAPGTRIGTSNRAIADEIAVAFDRPGALIMLPRPALAALADGL